MNDANEKAHEFGGEWTQEKLNVLAKYLHAYTTALQRQPFRKEYIDAFAGTGYRTESNVGREEPSEAELFPPQIDGGESKELLDGSARLALRTVPSFDEYIFIEKDTKRCLELEGLKHEFSDKSNAITILPGDANDHIQRLCNRDWRNRRAVLFLDPYGTQVEWDTIRAIAATKAIDLFILFPLGVAVNRMITRSGQFPPGWQNRLNILLGTDKWKDEFYERDRTENLFGEVEESVWRVPVERIGSYFNDRLKTIFPGVAEEPGVLRNSRHCPLYLLCFAVANERGKKVALKIARHLLRDLR